jgi:energy-coupling factor transport system permease protein
MNRMPTGMYVSGNSLLHRSDARLKILSFCLVLTGVFAARSAGSWLCVVVLLSLALVISRLPLLTLFSPVLRMKSFIAVVFLMNVLFFDGSGELWSWWIFHISQEGLFRGCSVTGKFLLVVIAGNILTCTTTPMAFTRAIRWFMQPLRWLHVPVDEIALILSVALQFIPILMQETDRIRMAQISRGAKFESRKFSERTISALSLFIPVFVTAFKRADELSTAMESRGYGCSGHI